MTMMMMKKMMMMLMMTMTMMTRGLNDSKSPSDGFKAVMIFNHRFDVKTSTSFLSSLLEVANPPAIKG
eukprot:2515375-Karenia_brevis.AAC.1